MGAYLNASTVTVILQGTENGLFQIKEHPI